MRVRAVVSVVLVVLLLGALPSPASAGTDDYPADLRNAPKDSKSDPWGFTLANRECVSFVAWRLNQSGTFFRSSMQGPNGATGLFAQAHRWAATARSIGFVVDSTPAVGAVAHWGSGEGFGEIGHVAWVEEVNDDFSVTAEQYNVGQLGFYSRSTFVEAPRYIHFDPAWERDGGHRVQALAGDDRAATAIATSRATYPATGSAGAVVLSRADSFADALAGTPLAVATRAPLLLTSSARLDPATELELRRVLPAGGTVHLLGGTSALGPAVADAVRRLGFQAVRYAGADRYATAVDVATRGLGAPGTILLADGTTFPSALVAGPAAATQPHAAVLLTRGAALPPATASYLAGHPGPRFAIGSTAAAAFPAPTVITAADPAALSSAVASTFFGSAPTAVALADEDSFADALSGGAHAGTARVPLLLTDTDVLPGAVADYLRTHRDTITEVYVYGGRQAVSTSVVNQVRQTLLGWR